MKLLFNNNSFLDTHILVIRIYSYYYISRLSLSELIHIELIDHKYNFRVLHF